ncbi:MAG: enoyl-CoA hydratase/isomerase family protein [Acetobacteraceae bacterium]|nr:enoyl-CoA hydratase/isomerase family protein [Acetobacteraceae bacterium]
MGGAGEVKVELRERPAGGGRVAFVSIAAAHRLNLLDSALMLRFAEAMAGLSGQAGLRAAVVSGAAQRPFVGGADIREMGALRDREEARAFIELVHGCCRAVRDCPVPVIARIEGYALGAGLELAAACDLRIAAADARFGMPEVRVGIPSVVEAALLPMLIGWGRTRRLLLLGEIIGAAEALEWGLVERVAPASGLDDAVEDWLGHLDAAGPAALRSQKALMRQWENLPADRAIAAGIDAFAAAWSGDEPARMMRRFLERPRPAGAAGRGGAG